MFSAGKIFLAILGGNYQGLKKRNTVPQYISTYKSYCARKYFLMLFLKVGKEQES